MNGVGAPDGPPGAGIRVGGHRTAVLISAGLIAATVVLIGLSLRREPPAAYTPSATGPGPAGDSLVGPTRVTVDASGSDGWVFYDFADGRVVADPGPAEWDLAFRRFHVAVNGGADFAGRGGVVDLGEVAFEEVASLPPDGYVGTDARRDSANPAIARWYDYGFTSHLLTPKPRVYGVRTADGRYAKLRFLSYYCPGAQPGCMTFEYVYQGDGTRRLR